MNLQFWLWFALALLGCAGVILSTEGAYRLYQRYRSYRRRQSVQAYIAAELQGGRR